MTINVNSVAANGQTAVAKAVSTAGTQSLNQTDFLKLLTTQLTNQDPTAPLDNSQFVSQLTQFSMLNGITALNDGLSGISTKLDAGKSTTATNLIGKSVLVPGNVAVRMANGSVAGAVDVASAADDVSVQIADANNNPLRTLDLGARTAGLAPFQWDGTDAKGAAVTGSSFRVTATATTAGVRSAATTNVYGRVDGVDLAAGGGAEPSLTVEGPGAVGLDKVRAVAG